MVQMLYNSENVKLRGWKTDVWIKEKTNRRFIYI
jgi:hypothetical protein